MIDRKIICSINSVGGHKMFGTGIEGNQQQGIKGKFIQSSENCSAKNPMFYLKPSPLPFHPLFGVWHMSQINAEWLIFM